MVSDAPTNWRNFTVPTFAGQFDTHIETGEDYHIRTLGDFWGMVPAGNPKTRAPAIIPSSYHAYDARTHAVQRQHGQFVALTGDIDQGNVPIADIVTHTRVLFGSEVAIFIYSTGSATPDGRRWRIIAPLEIPVPFTRWNDGQSAFYAFMEANGVPIDWSLARAAQPVYLPNVPPERRDANGSPLFFESYVAGEEGVPL